MTHFGSVARLREASVQEITAVPGIGVATASAVLQALRADGGTSAVVPDSAASPPVPDSAALPPQPEPPGEDRVEHHD